MRQPVARHLHGRVRGQAGGPQGHAAGATCAAAHRLGGEATRLGHRTRVPTLSASQCLLHRQPASRFCSSTWQTKCAYDVPL